MKGRSFLDGLQGVIQRPDITARLRSAFRTKGRAVAPTLGDVCHPVAIVEDMSRKDSIFDAGVDRSGGWWFQIAAQGATKYNFGILWNPKGSGILIAPTRATITHATSTGGWYASFTYNIPGVAGIVVGAVLLDTRLTPVELLTAPVPSSETYTGNITTTIGQPIWSGRTLANTKNEVDLSGIVLAEGTGLCIQSATVNVEFICSLFWRERNTNS